MSLDSINTQPLDSQNLATTLSIDFSENYQHQSINELNRETAGATSGLERQGVLPVLAITGMESLGVGGVASEPQQAQATNEGATSRTGQGGVVRGGESGAVQNRTFELDAETLRKLFNESSRLNAPGSRRRNEGLDKPNRFPILVDSTPHAAESAPEAKNFPQGADIIKTSNSGDGGITIERRDGTKQTFWNDGTERVENPDGTGFVRRPDGTVEHWGPNADDNYKETATPDGGKRFQYADGVDKTVNRDGSLTYRNSDGTTSTWTMKPSDPNIISLNPDDHKPYWQVETTGRDGRKTTSRSYDNPPHSNPAEYVHSRRTH